MKVKRSLSTMDQIIYYLACIFSLGSVWVFRVIISMAIQQAAEKE